MKNQCSLPPKPHCDIQALASPREQLFHHVNTFLEKRCISDGIFKNWWIKIKTTKNSALLHLTQLFCVEDYKCYWWLSVLLTSCSVFQFVRMWPNDNKVCLVYHVCICKYLCVNERERECVWEREKSVFLCVCTCFTHTLNFYWGQVLYS